MGNGCNIGNYGIFLIDYNTISNDVKKMIIEYTKIDVDLNVWGHISIKKMYPDEPLNNVLKRELRIK